MSERGGDGRYTDDDRLRDQRGQLTNPLPGIPSDLEGLVDNAVARMREERAVRLLYLVECCYETARLIEDVDKEAADAARFVASRVSRIADRMGGVDI